MKMWSICDSSASVRSPTPVPQSIRMSPSTRNEAGRRWRPPIPPEQPRTRRRMRLLLLEGAGAVPVGGRRRATETGRALGEQLVHLAPGVHALQVDEIALD